MKAVTYPELRAGVEPMKARLVYPTMQELQTTDALPFILIREASFPGSWGRGETVADAVRNVRANGAKDGPVYVALVSRDAYVEPVMGELFAEHRGPLYRATLHGRGVHRLVEYSPAR